MHIIDDTHLQQHDSLHGVRQELTARLGHETIAELNRSKPLLDLGVLVVIFSSFFIVAYLLAHLKLGFLWLMLLLLQGFILQIFGLCTHDMFTHRGLGGPKLAYLGSLLCMLPIGLSPTAYKEVHLRHHFYLNTEQDTEEYKLDLNGILKRIFYLTFIGQIFAMNRKLATKEMSTQKKLIPFFDLANENAQITKRLKAEKWAILIYFLLVGIVACLYPKLILLGYLLPLIITLPIASSLRLILEHADVDVNNKVQMATFYKTNFITRLLFLCDSGDCHLVHHIYPAIPFYKMNKALNLMRSYFIEKGIIERKSLIKLLYYYFVKNSPIRQPWPE